MSDAARGGGYYEHADQANQSQPRLAVIIDGQPGSVSGCRIDDPDRVMRAWSMLIATDEELHKVTLPPGAESRLGRQLRALAAELQRSLSPELTAELRRLLSVSGSEGSEGSEGLTPAELRVEYAGLQGWTGGLVIAVLGQLEKASAHRSSAPRLEPPPG